MIDMVRKDIMPACIKFEKVLAETTVAKKAIGIDVSDSIELSFVKKINELIKELERRVEIVEERSTKAKTIKEIHAQSRYVCDELYPTLNQLREVADELEIIVGDEYWPFPAYRDLLFSV